MMARAIVEGADPFFLSPSEHTTVTAAKTEQFVGVWDMLELVDKYTSDINFHMLPISRLQSYFDFQDISCFREIFQDFKQSRSGRFTYKQLEALRSDNNTKIRERSDSFNSSTSIGSSHWMSTLKTLDNDCVPSSSSSNNNNYNNNNNTHARKNINTNRNIDTTAIESATISGAVSNNINSSISNYNDRLDITNSTNNFTYI
jgi:hypothetical protein